MRIAPPIAITARLVLSCLVLIVILSGSAVAQTSERADKRFFGWTEDSKQHGLVTPTIEAGNKLGTAFAAGMQGHRVLVVYRRDILRAITASLGYCGGAVSAQVGGANPYSEIREMERAGEQIGQGIRALIRSWLAVSGVLALAGGVTAYAISREKGLFTEILGAIALVLSLLVTIDLLFRWGMAA